MAKINFNMYDRGMSKTVSNIFDSFLEKLLNSKFH